MFEFLLLLSLLFMAAFVAPFFWFAIRGIAPTRTGFELIGIVWRLAFAALGFLFVAWMIFGLLMSG